MIIESLFLKTIIAAIGASISSSVIGVFILWKRMAYFSDAISHSAIFGIAIATIISIFPEYGIILCAITFCLIIFLLGKFNLYSFDTIIGITSCFLLALGMILLTIFPSSIKLENYLFGDLILVSEKNIIFIYLVGFLTLFLIKRWFSDLLLVTINKDLAIISGIKVDKLELKFLLLCAFIVASLVKIVGIFLITSMLLLPAAIARNFAKSPPMMIIIALISGIFIVIGGIFFAFVFDLPTSPSIIISAVFLLIIAILITNISYKKPCKGF